MFKPDELKNRTFKKNLGGSYNASDIDDFLAQLIDDYTKIYTDNAELQLKLEMLAERLTAYKKEEQKLKTAVANVKLLCDSLIREANEKSEKIVKDAVTERDSIVNALSETVADKRREITSLNTAIAEYKESMLFKYKLHYDSLTALPLFDIDTSKKLVDDSEERIAALKNQTQEIPVLLDEKGEAETEEVAEFIEPIEPVQEEAPKEMPQQIIKAQPASHKDADTISFVPPVKAAEAATEEPTVVFDRPIVSQEADMQEEETVSESVPEEQITIEEAEQIEKSRPTEEILMNFAPRERVKEVVQETVPEQDEEEEEELDAPSFLKNNKNSKPASEEEKKSIIDSIKSALAEKEEAERQKYEQEEKEQAEFEDISSKAMPIEDVEEEEEIVSSFRDDIRFGEDADDDDDEEDADGFFSFFKAKK